MHNPIVSKSLVLSLFILLVAWSISSAQNLTVREIMAEPSIAGMRVDGEKLAPDGTKVVFLWNAEGKMPRDLYLVSTSGGDARKILSPSDLPPPSRPPEKENKLDYGLVLRDEFLKSRENQLGNFEWSPDSKRLVFSYGGDLFILLVNEPLAVDRWPLYEKAMVRRADLIPKLVKLIETAGVQENEIFSNLASARALFLAAVSNGPPENPASPRIGSILAANQRLTPTLARLLALQETYPTLQSNDGFVALQTELAGVENRINVARDDYEFSKALAKPRRLTKTQAPETSARFLDNDRILYSQAGHVFVWNIETSLITQVTRESNPTAFVSVFNPTPNKPGTLIAYVVSDSSKQRALIVPNYLDEFAAAPTTRRGWTEQKVMVMPADGSRDTPFEVKLPKPEGVSSIRRMVWASDNSSLIIDRIDKDTKRRTLFYVYDVGSKSEKIIPIIEETDDKWQASLSSIFEPNPRDPSELFFGSEKDGFNHLYLARLERLGGDTTAEAQSRKPSQAETRTLGSVYSNDERVAEGPPGFSGKLTITQLTEGNWQVEWAKWLPEPNAVAYLSSTEKDSSIRRFSTISTKSTEYLQILKLHGDGMNSNPQLSDQSNVVIYGYSKWNHPEDLMASQLCIRCPEGTRSIQLTKTIPERFTRIKWTEPKFLEIPSRDGKKIPAKIYLPPNFNAKSKQKYPMVIFVHGAGYLQNVINGWNNYYREFMFNDLLAKKGYVVLDIDYRGSAGYGRDWRTDVYDFLGGKDYEDHIDSIDYMVVNYNVNPAKVGAYGGSYGGFMAGMLAMRAPDKIAAAAALRPVFDWKNYYAANPGYTAQRLGFPDKNPEAYKRSSPITYADKLERPLLILHGMSDDNVHVQDSIQLMEKLIRLGKTKYFEAMLYPSENHGFVRPESWADEYERILAFFEKHLR